MIISKVKLMVTEGMNANQQAEVDFAGRQGGMSTNRTNNFYKNLVQADASRKRKQKN
jgi:hypothetical protein